MLRHYVPQDYSMLEAFQLSESDLKFVKTPEENITAAMSDNERYFSGHLVLINVIVIEE